MRVIRYSRAFKLQAVREVESGQGCAGEVQRKYGVRGVAPGWLPGTPSAWPSPARLPRDWGFRIGDFGLGILGPVLE
jgi:hypothetical protein